MKFYTAAVEELRRMTREWNDIKKSMTQKLPQPDYPFGFVLEDINTQRILFDGRQAMTFWDMDEPPPLTAMEKLQPPFDDFYLEFTHPISIQTPARVQGAETELLNSVLFISKPEDMFGSGSVPRASMAILFWTPVTNAPRFKTHVHTLYLDMSTGESLGRVDGISVRKEIQETTSWMIQQGKISDEEVTALSYVLSEDWDVFDDKCATFWSWVVVYMMAKGISLTSEEPTKKERRRMEAKRTPVKPWHIITVEPTLRQGADAGPSGTSRKHSYRYDVMGHLRFGKHKTKTVDEFGNPVYKHTVEWVSAHQRGVKNMRYVPAVRQFKRGKETHPVFREYMRGEIVEA